jgi:hypothetical protein
LAGDKLQAKNRARKLLGVFGWAGQDDITNALYKYEDEEAA